MSENLNLLKYACRNAWLGIRRHWALFLSSVFTVFLAMLLIAVFVILGLHVNTFSLGTARQMQIHVILDDDLNEEQIQKVQQEIEALDNVAGAELSDRDQELELMIAEKGEAFAVYRGEDNPLSDAFFVTLRNEQDIASTAAVISEISGVSQTAYGGSSVADLARILNMVRWVSFFFIILLLFLAFYLIYNTIRTTISSRQAEIGIMWTVGATPAFIRGPFEMEGVCIGLAGALIPYIMVTLMYPKIYDSLNGHFFVHAFRLISPGRMDAIMGLILFGLGILAGFLASYLSASKYIRAGHFAGKGIKG